MNTNRLSDSITSLTKSKKPTKTIEKLLEAGIKTIEDLMWIVPLRIQKMPTLASFNNAHLDELFIGQGTVVQSNVFPAFGRKGKGKVQLFNINLLVKDSHSDNVLRLKWFNSYPNVRKQMTELKEFIFMGTIKESKGELFIANPKINPIINGRGGMLIEYPTINGIAGKHIQSLIAKIPDNIWQEPNQGPTESLTLREAFACLHGKSQEADAQTAIKRLKYEEIFLNQIKARARKARNQSLKALKFTLTKKRQKEILRLFPYQLTNDQMKVLEDVQRDLQRGFPMMRMIQGDVGCGKTSVAIAAALIVIDNQSQVAFMCPTEALATQHFKTLQEILPRSVKTALLLGSTSSKEKKSIYDNLKSGAIDLIIGTHSLIQDKVEFSLLSLAIIDEQHKFGVNQRIKLYQKGEGVHSLIMTATPIPRSLQLAQYGDLEISTIKELPAGRKGIKTRIVTPDKMNPYLSFIKTRVSLGEQIYIVVPAIEESLTLDIQNVKEIKEQYQKFFPEMKIHSLHGQMRPEEKQQVMQDFEQHKFDILISTTVIEVGINILNSTVISIYNPERFGLSSLHQLRGRVGRGEKPGFCFLVCEKQVSTESMERLKVIENTLDGFEISEADLKFRGQGDLFGANQSGHQSSYRLANIILDFDIFDQVTRDISQLEKTHPEYLNNLLLAQATDLHVSTTI